MAHKRFVRKYHEHELTPTADRDAHTPRVGGGVRQLCQTRLSLFSKCVLGQAPQDVSHMDVSVCISHKDIDMNIKIDMTQSKGRNYLI